MSQKQTYTKEQLEALRDCDCMPCTECVLNETCFDRHEKGYVEDSIINLAADLLSANKEIERLREALKWVTETQKANHGNATDLHIAMLDWPEKYNTLKGE